MIRRWIQGHAAHTPDAPALGFEAQRLSYAALDRRIAAAAAMLTAQGIGHGDRIAFLGLNHPAQLILLFACARLGAIQVPLNWRLAAPELRFILEDSGAVALAATQEMREAARFAAPAGCTVLEAEATWPAAPMPPPTGEADDPVLLVYTSGTTGRPKGAVLDQQAVLFNALNAIHAFGLTAADRVLTLLPLFHVGGLNIQTMPALLAGAEVVLLPRFDAATFFAAIAEHRPTLTLLVPAVMQALVAHPGWQAADLSSLRAIGAGSSEVPLPLIEAFHARGIPVQQVYGATETGPVAICQTRGEALAAPGSLGQPALHGEARVVDPAGRELPPGEAGEIQLRGPHLARGYWGAPDPTAAAFRDGWFASGDVGRRDADGRFWFTDRLKHVIISGGENIYPAEVERVLRTAPGVLEGAVCGRPDPRWGEVPVAVVVPGEGFDAAAVLRHFEGQLARFKHPRDVVAVEALPRTALGKVQVEALRAIARGG
ncbi:AMP-binding protein [Roseicella aerolata]|uniref:AMP-binding protein n=1 Tax=Roseicella aerolata TaxID=2883479 RepID=A0A9X1IA92_9PROT|nr:AMP-binding protein [Roseicella aerolata]MCB4820591.1 AMP-binding protein [Roseicella aerolata]